MEDRYRAHAVNLTGDGETSAWHNERSQTSDDQARVVEAAIPDDAELLYLVGRSFGRVLAMKTAARLSARVAELILLEANPCYLLRLAGSDEAFAQAIELRNCIKAGGDSGD